MDSSGTVACTPLAHDVAATREYDDLYDPVHGDYCCMPFVSQINLSWACYSSEVEQAQSLGGRAYLKLYLSAKPCGGVWLHSLMSRSKREPTMPMP